MISKLHYSIFILCCICFSQVVLADSISNRNFLQTYQSSDCHQENLLVKDLDIAALNQMLSVFMDPCIAFANILITYSEFNECGSPGTATFSADVPNLSDIQATIIIPDDFNYLGNVMGGTEEDDDPLIIEPIIQNEGDNGSISFSFELQAKCDAPDDQKLEFMFSFENDSIEVSCQELSLPLRVDEISLFIAEPGTPGRNTEESVIAVLDEEHDIILTLVQEGVGHIENIFFYVDDHPQLEVDSILIDATGHVLEFERKVGNRSYYLIDTSGLGGDGFQRNEGIDVRVQWQATDCPDPGDSVDDVVHGVISSCALDPREDICESSEYRATVDFGEKVPEIRHMMDISANFDPLCYSDGPTEQAWFFINTGEAPAGDIIIRIDDHGGAPMMDLSTLEVQIGSGGTPFTPAIKDYSALNRNGIPGCALPANNDFYSDFTYEMESTNLDIGDTIFVRYDIESPDCDCGGANCSPPKRFAVEVQDVEVLDLCGTNVQDSPISNNGNLDRWPGFDVNISSFMESPITICDGDSETLTTNISNYTNSYLSNDGFSNGAERNTIYEECTDCYLEVEYIIPHGLDWAGSSASDVLWFDNDGTTYHPDYVSYTDNNGGADMLTLRWIGQEISGFDPFNEYSTILLDYTIDCDNELIRPAGCGYAITEVTITRNVRFSTGSCTNCTSEDIECDETIPVVAKCIGNDACTPCEGFVQTYAYGQRTNLREADEDNDGSPNGAHNDMFLRRDRFLKGDSIEVSMGGFVQLDSDSFDYVYGVLEMPNDEFIPIGGQVTIITNGGPTYTCDVLTQSIIDDTLLVTDLSISRLSMNGCSVPLSYNDGDSVFVTYYFKPTMDFNGEVDLLRYKTRMFASSEPYGGDENSCRLPIEFRMTQVGLQSDNVVTQNGNIGGCSRKVVRYEGYSRVGGRFIDYFPGEYIREIDVVSTVSATIPDGMTFDYFRVVLRRKNASSATNQGSSISGVPSSDNIYAPHPALTVVGDQVFFNLEEYTNEEYGDYPISDEGYSYSLEFRFTPSCKLDIGPLDPINVEANHTTNKEMFCSSGYSYLDTVVSSFNGGAEISIQVIGSDSIIVDQVPTCTRVRVTNIGEFNADNTWLTFGSESGYVVFSSLSEINGSDTTPVSGGLYNMFEIGDLGKGKSVDFELCVYANICVPEKLTVYAGYDCQEYPTVIEEATCFDKANIFLRTVEPSLSMKSKTPTDNVLFDDVCDTATYIVDINASGPGFLDDIELEIELPLGIEFVEGSFDIAYPTSVDAVTVPPENEFESIGDPDHLYGNTYVLNVTDANSILQNEGLIGSAGSAFNLNVVNVRFDVVTSCGFAAGSRLFYEASAKQGCGSQLLPIQKDFSVKMGLLGSPPPFVSDIEIQADTLEACMGESTTISVTYAVNGKMTTNDQDSLRVILPPGISYVSGSYRKGTNILPDPPSVLNEYGLEVLYWGITGLDPGSSATFSLDIIANDIGQACKDYAFMVETFKSSEAYCDVTGQTCTVRALSDQARENIFIIKPNLIVESASISSMAAGEEEMIMLDVGFKNDSEVEMASGSAIVLDIYGDLNNDGRLDKDADTILTSINYNVSLTPGESAVFSSTANIPAEFSCALLAVIDVSKNCSCENTTSARITSDLQLKFQKEIEVCSNSDFLIGPNYNNSYGYSWVGLGGADVSSLSRMDSTPVIFNYSNTLSSPVTFNYGLIVSRGIGCYILDTVQVTVYPDNSESLTTTVCGPVPSCGSSTGFALSGPVTGSDYNWSIIHGDMSAMIDDDSDPTSQVSTGISVATVFELEYVDINGCSATFVQTVSTISCACTTLGDTVWYDLDVDGMQDVGEPGIPGMTVFLFDANDLNSPIQSTSTDANGYYIFQPLPQGNYVVRFDTLGNEAPYHLLIPTSQDMGGDTTDSDADVLTGYTAPIFLSNGISNYTIDAGFYPAFDLALKKEIDLVHSPGPYFPGDTINYTITVYNQGGYYGASEITIVDYFTSDLIYDDVESGIVHSNLGVNVTVSDLGGGSFQLDTLPPNDTAQVSMSFIIHQNFSGSVIDNYAEISSFSNDFGLDDVDSKADSDPDNDAGGNPESASDNTVVGNGGGPVLGSDPVLDEDDHDPARVYLQEVDLALMKRVDPNYNAPPIVVDEYVKFDIIVINQGDVAVDSIEVFDKVPAGFEFDYSWPLNASEGWNADSSVMIRRTLLPGARDTTSIYLKALSASDSRDYINQAEIIAAYDTITGRDVAPYDIDSSPGSDTPSENATEPGSPGDNNIVSTGLNDTGSEDDHDVETVEVTYVDVAIKKEFDPSFDFANLQYGDTVKYLLTIENQGTLDADSLYITDYIPVGLGFDATIDGNSRWTEVDDTTLVAVIKDLPGNSETTLCTWLVFKESYSTEDWTNQVEISKFVDDKGIDRSKEDIDSPLNGDKYDNGGGASDTDSDNATSGDGTGLPESESAANDQDNADPARISFFDLALIKEIVTPGPYKYGDTLSYEITVVNQGNVPATNIVVSDSLPVGLVYESSINIGLGWSGSHPVLTNLITDTLEIGDTVSLNINLILQPTAGGFDDFLNISEITKSEDDKGNDKTDEDIDDDDGDDDDNENEEDNSFDDGDDDRDIDKLEIVDLALRKTSEMPRDVAYGDTIRFDFGIFNQGNIAAKNVLITDYVPCGYRFDLDLNDGWAVIGSNVQFTVGDTILPGDSTTVSINLVIQPCTESGAWKNMGEIGGSEDIDGNDTTDDDIDSVADDDETNDGRMEDNSITGTNADEDDSDYDNSYDEDDSDPEEIGVFDLALIKEIVTPGPYKYGDTLTYDIIVVNQGNIAATNIEVTDSLPSGLIYITGQMGWSGSHHVITSTIADTLQMGDTVKLSVDLILTQTTGDSGNYTNISEITKSEDDKGNDKTDEDIDDDDGDDDDNENEEDNSFDDGDDDRDIDKLEIVDLALRKTSEMPRDVAYGDTIRFDFGIFNQGNIAAKNVLITDYVPCGYRFDLDLNDGWAVIGSNVQFTVGDTILPGDSTTVSINLVIQPCTESGAWKNMGEIGGSEDIDGNDTTDDDIDSVADDDETNDGRMEDNSITGTNADEDDSDYDNSYDEDDSDPEEIGVFDLALIKEIVTPGPYKYGDTLNYQITVVNQGNIAATNIEVTDSLPSGLIYITGQMGWSGSHPVIKSTIADTLQMGDTVKLSVDLIFTQTMGVSGNYSNISEITKSEDDKGNDKTDEDIDDDDGDSDDNENETDDSFDDGDDDRDNAEVEIYDLALRKTLQTPQPHKYGDTIEFQISIFNQGNKIVKEIEIVEYMPCGLVYDSSRNDALEWMEYGGNQALITLDNMLLSGDSLNVSFYSIIEACEGEGAYVNYTEIKAFNDEDGLDSTAKDADSKGDDDNSNDGIVNDDNINNDNGDEDDHDSEFVELYDLALNKRLNRNSIDMDGFPFDTVWYDIQVFNQGNVPIKNIRIADYLPCGLAYNSGLNDPFGWSLVMDTAYIVIHDTIMPDSSLIVPIFLDILMDYDLLMACPKPSPDPYMNYSEIVGFENIEGENRNAFDLDSEPGSDSEGERKIVSGFDGDNDITSDGTNGNQDDHDPANLSIFDLALTKDLDRSYNHAPYRYGDTIKAFIELVNQGNVCVDSISVVDYLPDGMEYILSLNRSWTYDAIGHLAHTTYRERLCFGEKDSVFIYVRLLDGINSDSYTNWAEITAAADTLGTILSMDEDSRFDTMLMNDTGGLPNSLDDNNTNGDGTNIGEDEDDHDPLELDILDLALKKEFVDEMQSFDVGSDIKFKITLFNQGNIDVSGLILYDYLPEGLKLSSLDTNHWVQVNDSTLRLDWRGELRTDDSISICAITTILPGARLDRLINYAEIGSISDTTGADISYLEVDSHPDSTRDNDVGAELYTPTNDQIDDHGHVDEDDHDVAIAAYVDLALFKTTDRTIPVRNGDDVKFDIHVINQGLIVPEKVAVVDYIPSGFELSPNDTNGWVEILHNVVVDTVYGVIAYEDTISIPIILRVNNPNRWEDLINEAEISFAEDSLDIDITGFDRDSEPDSDNMNDNGGEVFGSTDNETLDDGMIDEDDHDPAAPPFMDIALKKTVIDKGRPVLWNDTLEYTFYVYNQGNVIIQNVDIVDYIADGYTFSGSNLPEWNLENPGLATTVYRDTILPGDSVLISLDLIINEGAQLGDLINYGEIAYFEDKDGDEAVDFDSQPDRDKENDGDVNDNITDGSQNDEDDHDIVVPELFDLALRKQPIGSSIVEVGDTVDFLIEIFNQGSIDATSVEIADFNQSGLYFSESFNPDWKTKGDNHEYVPTLDVRSGEVDSIYIRMVVVSGANSFNLINEAEIISARDGNGFDMNIFDIDSKPDADFDNDIGGLPGGGSDDEIGDIGIIDEDDHDPAAVTVCNPIACKGNINVSITDDCVIDLTPIMLLTDTTYRREEYDIEYFDLDGNPIENIKINERMNVMISVPGCTDVICWTEVLVEDKLAPVIECMPDDTISCLEMLTYTDPTLNMLCSNVDVQLVFENYETLCDNDSIVAKSTRSYQAIDQSGNKSDICTQIIYIKAPSIGAAVFPGDTTLSCDLYGEFVLDSLETNFFGVPMINTLDLTDPILQECNVLTSYEDFVIVDLPCKKKIMRMWEVRKWTCGGGDSTRTMPQIIDIIDTVAPVINYPDTVIIASSNNGCSSTVFMPGLTAEDNCSGDVQIDLSSSEGFARFSQGELLQLSVDTHKVEIQAIDACHNVSRDSVILIIKDETPPIALCLSETVVAINGNESVTIGPDHFDLGSEDGCGAITLKVARMDATCDPDDIVLGDKVSFCCSDIGNEVMVMLQAADINDNSSLCMVNVTVQDKGIPSLDCPPDITVGCDLVIGNLDMFGSVRFEGQQQVLSIAPEDVINTSGALIDGVAFGNCLDSISVQSSQDINNCGVGKILRIFTVVDMSGNTNSCTQEITITNNGLVMKPTIVYPSDTVLYGCIDTSDLIPLFIGEPSTVEGRCNLIGFAHKDLYINFNNTQDSGCWKVMRTWSVFDMCSGKSDLIGTKTQEIKVINQTDPLFVDCSSDTSVVNIVGSCTEGRVELSRSIVDDCTSATAIKWRVELDSNLDGIPESSIIPTVTGNGDTSIASVSTVLPFGTHRLLWVAEDLCGNRSACEQFVNIQGIANLGGICLSDISADLLPVDDGSGQNGQPDSTVAGDGIADGGRITVNASSYDVGSSYFSCNQDVDIVYSFSNTSAVSEMQFDCSDLGIGSILVYVLAIDDQSNTILEASACNVNINVTDSQNACDGVVNNPAAILISGQISSDQGENIEEVEVRLSDLNDGDMTMDMTSNLGEYAFNNGVKGDYYKVAPYKNDDWINGVSTLDLILIQSHILAKGAFEDPYKLVAADINGDGHISAIDLVFLRKLILGITDKIDQNTSWRFIWKEQDMDEYFDLRRNLTEEYLIRPLVTDMSIDWVGVKIGDISGNAVANEIQRAEGRSRRTTVMNYDITTVNDQMLVSFYLPKIKQIQGLQGEMVFPTTWKLNEVIGHQVVMNNDFVHLRKNQLAYSINTLEPLDLNMDKPLFSVMVSGIRSESDVIDLSTLSIASELYSEHDVFTYSLRLLKDNEAFTFDLDQNMPNPWMESTLISFTIPNDGEATLKIFNTTGELVYSKKGDFRQGGNSISIDKNDLATTGSLIYEITFDDQKKSRKMIHIK